MTTKNTILVSAATCLAVNFSLWLLGWMVLPIVWLAMGYGSIKVCEWVLNRMTSSSEPIDGSVKFICYVTGPLMGITAFLSDGIKHVSFPKFPKMRNPFIWPND